MRKPTTILLLFILTGALYAVTTPIFEASDELWHYPFVRHLADGNGLPVQDPDHVGLWKQEASQQPLYYALAAALTFWIDTSDMESVRMLNPHVDNGVLTEDGNINLILHRPESGWPWTGTKLAIRLIRLVSVLMGAGTVYFTWLIASILLPDRPELVLGATAFQAFTPMFLFISGAVNNDNLAMLLSSASLYLILRNTRRNREPRHTSSGGLAKACLDSLLLGGVLGLAALTKTSAIGLIPLALGSLVISTWPSSGVPSRDTWFRMLVCRSLALVVPILSIAGWWYMRNIRLYGDWLGWNAFIQVLGQRAQPATLLQLWGERWGFSLSYWGLFGGVNVPMPEWIYHVLNGAAIIGFFGLGILFVRQICTHHRTNDGKTGSGLDRVVKLVQDLWPWLLLIGWTTAILVGLLRWATTTWSSQGRLVFPAISAISILLVAGLFHWLPRRISGWGAIILGFFMFGISIASPLLWITPAYQPPSPPDDTEIAAVQYPLNVAFGDRIRLEGFELHSNSLKPGEKIELVLYWQVLAPMEKNWSVFVHLNDPVIGAPIAQRDMYPGQGLIATRWTEPGQRIRNRYIVQVPETVYAPSATELVVGLYDYTSGERLLTDNGNDSVKLAPVSINVAPGNSYPNPVSDNFGKELGLVGYEINPRRVYPGDQITLTLYWKALAPTDIDYTVFAHLRDIEDPSNRLFGQKDSPLPGGTSNWAEGQVQEAHYLMDVASDTPPAVYEIEVGVYSRNAEGEISRLQRVTPDGRLIDNFLILTKVRVD